MADDSEATKKAKTTNNSDVIDIRKQDKLSHLPDEILIEIISLLPINLAIATGSLSRRWRSIWTNVSTDSFSVEIDHAVSCFWTAFVESWLRLICNRKVREFKLTNGKYLGRGQSIEIPSLIFETQTLVSLKLCYCNLHLPFNSRFNLPNLKNLELIHSPLFYKWLGTLIAACPSLEDVILISRVDENHGVSRVYFNCSNQNLRRLFINIFMNRGAKVVINAPKLEYLGVRAVYPVTLCFGEEPVLLREAEINSRGHDYTHLEAGNNAASKFYEAIGNVKTLELDFFQVDIASSVFRNVTRLSFNMKALHNLNTLLLLLEKFPVLDVLNLKFGTFYRNPDKPTNSNTLRRVLKRINIETCLENYSKTRRSFLELVHYLLSGAIDLKHFHFKVIRDSNWKNGSLEYEQERELKLRKAELRLCKLLYRSPMVSMGCDVEFVGLVLNMSGKDSPKAWKNNGKCIRFGPKASKNNVANVSVSIDCPL